MVSLEVGYVSPKGGSQLMRFVRTLVCVSSLALGSVAYAQDPQTPPPEGTPAPAPAPAPAAAPAAAGGGGYMGPELNRALTMPQGGIEGDLALIINRFSTTTPVGSVSSTGESLALGGRYGIMPNLNAGALLAFRLNPDANFTDFLVNGEYEFMPGSMMMVAGRVDLGVTHGTDSNAFDLGLGLPFKYVLSPMLAFVSGSQYMITAFGPIPNNDILFFEFASGGTIVGLNIPLGVIAQITPMFNLQGSTGFALLHTSAADEKFVPINITAAANLNVGGIGIDPYFTFNIEGAVGNDAFGFGDFMNFLIGARLHL
jgi:hypothetical protein